MPVTLDEVRQIIRQSFAEANVDGVTETNHRIGGILVSPEFAGMDVTERNQLISKRVRDKLGLRGMNVGILFPLAPGERL